MRMACSVAPAAMKGGLFWIALASGRCTLKRGLQNESVPIAESFGALQRPPLVLDPLLLVRRVRDLPRLFQKGASSGAE